MKKRLVRIFLLLCGLALVPVCVAVTFAATSLVGVIRTSSQGAMPASAWAILIGLFLWIGIYAILPRPVRTYILAHELTHALWAYLMGATVKKFRLSKRGGSVAVSESNILITLAPYFFPLYTVIVILLYCAFSVFYGVDRYELLWLGLVGFTWGFHLTFTVSALSEHQSDMREYGRVFSYVFVYFMNVLGVGIWIVAVTRASLEQFAGFIGANLREGWTVLSRVF